MLQIIQVVRFVWESSQVQSEKEFDPSNASVITTMQGKKKKKLNYDLKIREALEIRRNKCGPGKGLNEDMGAYVKTDIWDPVLHTLDILKWYMWGRRGGGGPALSLGFLSLSLLLVFSPIKPLALPLSSFLATDDEFAINSKYLAKSLFFLQPVQ